MVQDPKHLLKTLARLGRKQHSDLSPWDRVLISRHTKRPRTLDYIAAFCEDFCELAGDRLYADDRALIGGFATIGGETFVVLGQEKGKDTESRLARNFGMTRPEGFRKALRLAKMAEKFQIPLLCFIDTPGAQPTLEAEERGQGWAIAENLREFSQLRTPIIAIIIGEGCSGGALGIGIADRIGMLEHAHYSVISPEGCASILFKDASRKNDAAAMLKLNAEDLLELGIIDHILAEPVGGAHNDPSATCETVKNFILKTLGVLRRLELDQLVEERYERFRKAGTYTEVDI